MTAQVSPMKRQSTNAMIKQAMAMWDRADKDAGPAGMSEAQADDLLAKLIEVAQELKTEAEQAEGVAKQAEGVAKKFYASLGLALAELKKRKPKDITWPVFVRKYFDYSRERADELIRIAEGKTTVEDVRTRAKASVKKSRENPVIRITGNTPTKSVESKPVRSSITAPAVFRRLQTAEDTPLARQVNLIVQELDGFVVRWIDHTKDWAAAHREELDAEDKDQVGGTGKDCLIRTIHEVANGLMRLAQAIDDR
jgi:hypothetical protein